VVEESNDWLKEADGIVIECEEEEINPYTLVSVTPFYTKKADSSVDGPRNMTLQEALNIKKRQIAKGENLIAYLHSRIGKKIFD